MVLSVVTGSLMETEHTGGFFTVELSVVRFARVLGAEPLIGASLDIVMRTVNLITPFAICSLEIKPTKLQGHNLFIYCILKHFISSCYRQYIVDDIASPINFSL